MSNATTVVRRTPQRLQSAIAGDVFVPGDPGYDEARRGFFLGVDHRPSVVVLPESAADVVRAVQFARSQGMRIAPQSTGHGAASVESLDGAMAIKTSRMRRVEISAATRVARVEAGANWQDVTVPAAQHGLAPLAGTSATVGVAGYTLGGGIGWLSRRHGLAANSVSAVEVVTVDGRLRRADAGRNRDLLWAVKGGGGSVGVVTALEMGLFPVPALYGGVLFFPIERSAQVLGAWRAWVETVPDEVTSVARILRVPPFPEIPDALRGRAFALVEAAYIGDPLAGAELLRPLRELGPELDTFAAIAAPALQTLHMDPDEPVAGEAHGALLTDLPTAAIDAVVSLAGPDAHDTPLSSVEIRHLGGALARDAPGCSAQPKIDAAFAMVAGGLTPTPELRDRVRAHADAITSALSVWRAGYDYYNFAEAPTEAIAVLPRESYRRLRQIKAQYDPDEAIISAHPVRPT